MVSGGEVIKADVSGEREVGFAVSVGRIIGENTARGGRGSLLAESFGLENVKKVKTKCNKYIKKYMSKQ